MSEEKSNKNIKIQFRTTDRIKNHAKIRADLYFKGNLSKWIEYCLQNATIKNVKKEG